MGNEYLNEIVEKAWYCTRPFTQNEHNDLLDDLSVIGKKILALIGLKHYGIRVLTNKGNYWLIHNAKSKERGEYGVYVTNAKMSSNWDYEEFDVAREGVTISECQTVMGWTGGHEKRDWYKSGTCLFAARILKEYLSNPEYDYVSSFNGKMKEIIDQFGNGFEYKLDEIINNDNLSEEEKRDMMFDEFISSYDPQYGLY